MPDREDRKSELRENLTAIRSRIEAACDAAGRPVAELTLIAVTKFFPVTDAVLLAELGVTDLGESRDQEASRKVADFAELATPGSPPVRWHFIGRLQKNKAKSVARYADAVHSVDRPELIAALDRGVESAGRDRLAVLVQVSLDGDTSRGGAVAEDVPSLAEQVAAAGSLTLAGVMAVAPLGADPDQAFAALARLAERLRADHPEARMLSAGMSSDLEAAVRHGATHLRIGTALLGRRTDTFG